MRDGQPTPGLSEETHVAAVVTAYMQLLAMRQRFGHHQRVRGKERSGFGEALDKSPQQCIHTAHRQTDATVQEYSTTNSLVLFQSSGSFLGSGCQPPPCVPTISLRVKYVVGCSSNLMKHKFYKFETILFLETHVHPPKIQRILFFSESVRM